MNAEDIPVSYSISDGDYTCPEIDVFRKKFNEEDQEHQSFHSLLIDLVDKHFRLACRRMMPLLETVQINNISLTIDILGFSSTTLATYSSGKSDTEAGIYLFTAKAPLISEYLANYFNNDIPLSPNVRYTWEHELIHMLDHGYISGLEYNLDRPDVTEVLVDIILSFRQEGVAQLFYFMKNLSRYRSVKAARTQFLRRMESLRNRPWNDPLFAKVARRNLKDDDNYYTLGTWMILHVLGCDGYPKMTPGASVMAAKIRKREEMADEEIINIIRQALEIDNYSFINCLTKPGPDGKPFIEFEELEDFARYVELCKADLERSWSKPAQLRGDPKIVELFRLLRPKVKPVFPND